MARYPGPASKTAKLKKQQGNPGRRRLNEAEPEPDSKQPDRPPHLDKRATETWDWLCDTLDKMGILSSSDVAIMTLYSETWVEYIGARESVTKYGPIMLSKQTGQPYSSPYLNQEAMFKKQLERYSIELGLTPVARTRVQTGSKQPTGKATLLRLRG